MISSQAALISSTTGRVAFKPVLANPIEARMGMGSRLGRNAISLNVGNSVDLVQWRDSLRSTMATMGADFFTYTLLHGEKDFHFPVDAVDYLFGLNWSVRKGLNDGVLSGRLRLSHISAHFVDGHYDGTTARWKDNRGPHVYSREFLELIAAYEPSASPLAPRIYGGGSYLFHTDPRNLSRWSGVAGIEFHRAILPSLTAYASYQWSPMKVVAVVPRNTARVGLKAGNWDGAGLNFSLSYFSGYSLHGEYYDVVERYFEAGFLVEF